MNILISLSQVRMGGTERVVLSVAQGLIQRGHQISLMTMVDESQDFYQFPPETKRINLDLDRRAPSILHSIWNTLLRVKAIRRTIRQEKPDVVLAFLPVNNLLTSMAMLGMRTPLLISERVYPSKERRVVRWLQRLIYPRATRFVSNSTGIDQYYHWVSPTKRRIIYNIPAKVNTEGISVLPDKTRAYVVSMGRFVEEKNFPLLVEAFGQLADEFPEWDLVILGDGVQKVLCAERAQALGLADRIHLPGRVSPPFATLKGADLFVLPSNFEGVPNVLLEAMSCGLPVITTDYFGEPRDIIENNQNGIIVPRNDRSALVEAMRSLMQDKAKRALFAQNAQTSLLRFNEIAILDEWEQLLVDMLESGN